MSRRIGLVARLMGLLATASLIAGACSSTPPRELAGVRRLPLPELDGASLPVIDGGAGGGELEFRAEDEGLLLVYFGYTSCPDVCPTTLADVRTARRELGDEQGSRVDLAMVTIDPERDTDEVLAGYVRSFVEDAHAVRTTDDSRLRRVAERFGVTYAVTPAEDGDEPEVIHTGSLFAVDAEARLVVTWPFGTPAEDLVNDLAILLDAGREET